MCNRCSVGVKFKTLGATAPPCEEVQQASEGGRETLGESLRESRKVRLSSLHTRRRDDSTYYPWEFGTLCRIVVKAAASGDWVRLLERKTHGIHGVAPAADHSLQRETRRRRRRNIQMAPTRDRDGTGPTGASGLNTDHYRQRALAWV